MENSLLTGKCTLVPSHFFDRSTARDMLAGVVSLEDSDKVSDIEIAQYGAVLIYGSSDGEESLPELYYVLQDLPSCREYNKILCSWRSGILTMAIAQGRQLLLANVYPAKDFTTAEYYIFLAMKSLQLNPEVSTVCWRSALDQDEEMSLYRYFKSVEVAPCE